MNFREGQETFLTFVKSIDKDSMVPLLKWIQSATENLIKDAAGSKVDDEIIQKIRWDLREIVPLSATFPSEVISLPLPLNQDDGSVTSTTLHIDSFLYDDTDVDELCDLGKIDRNYCVRCGSRQVAPLTFISHSTSVNQLKYIFHYLLPNLDGKTILDIGSRLGSVLYGAYVYSSASSIIGCEMNSDLCHVQQMIVEKYHFRDRIKIICADIKTQEEMLKTADVIILNNVFEYFLHVDEQEAIWQFLRSTIICPGTLIVTSPSIKESLKQLKTGIDITSWLREEDTSHCLVDANWNLFGCDESEESDLCDMHLYSVL